jgi:hypothetical protein
MSAGGKKKAWPRSWKQSAATGGRLTLKGRAVEVDYVVLPVRVEAGPVELEERVDNSIIAEAGKQRPS